MVGWKTPTTAKGRKNVMWNAAEAKLFWAALGRWLDSKGVDRAEALAWRDNDPCFREQGVQDVQSSVLAEAVPLQPRGALKNFLGPVYSPDYNLGPL